MIKEYIKPSALLVDSLSNYCLDLKLINTSGEYGLDHSDIVDDLYEGE